MNIWFLKQVFSSLIFWVCFQQGLSILHSLSKTCMPWTPPLTWSEGQHSAHKLNIEAKRETLKEIRGISPQPAASAREHLFVDLKLTLGCEQPKKVKRKKMNLIWSEKLIFYIVIIFICETTMFTDIADILFFLFCLIHKGKAVANAFKWANKLVFAYIHFTVICISMLELNSGPPPLRQVLYH